MPELDIDFTIMPLPQYGPNAYGCRCSTDPSIGGYRGFSGTEGNGRPVDALTAAIGQMLKQQAQVVKTEMIFAQRRLKEGLDGQGQ